LDNIQWLQKCFPKGEYQDVIGLCKIADIQEVIDEQDYSLNAGRYVGVEIEDDNISHEDFLARLKSNIKELEDLNQSAFSLEKKISEKLNNLVNA